MITVIIIVAAAIAVTRKSVPQPSPEQPVSTEVTNSTINLSHEYKNENMGISLRYPVGYSIDENYQYQLGTGKDIGGTQFTIPVAYATGTNLSTDSYFSVEEIQEISQCTADMFLDRAPHTQMFTENGVTYSVASTTGAAAGNRYEETVYALVDTNPCIAVRYFIHFGVIENYPEGMVREFDQQVLMNEFDAMRHMLIIEQSRTNK